MWWQALVAWNIFALLLMGFDKLKAKGDGRRVPERTLLLVAALLGSPGLLGGMYLWHHKTRKPKFFLGVPLMLIAQVTVIAWLIWRSV